MLGTQDPQHHIKVGMVAHGCNPITWEAGAGRSIVYFILNYMERVALIDEHL